MKSEKLYFLGIDGGGTKTACMLTDSDGKILSESLGKGTSYRQYSILELETELGALTERCCKKAGIPKSALSQIAFALPCYGENAPMDRELQRVSGRIAGDAFWYLTNDVEAGFAGSLALKPGINIVAGTGSIAFGQDERGKQVRCGGWSEHFSDLGSCYWAGKKAMEGFAKEAEEIVKKDALYRIMCHELSVASDMDFIAKVETEILPYREKTAAFQKFVLQAAKAGDVYARSIYQEAAKELFLIIRGVQKQLDFCCTPVPVSYSGGLFHGAQFVLPDLERLAKTYGMKLTPPVFTPVQGAVLLAAKNYALWKKNKVCERIIDAWLRGGNCEYPHNGQQIK